jgi:hypothetical protein
LGTGHSVEGLKKENLPNREEKDMSKMTFDNAHDAALYAAAFQHAAEYMMDAMAEMQQRGRLRAVEQRGALRHFARTQLAKVDAEDPCKLEIPHLEDWHIGYDRQGRFYAKPKS